MNRDLAPPRLLGAYMAGIFPMADEDGLLHWLAPDPRAIIELSGLKVSRSLRSVVRRATFEIRISHSFGDVIRCCADRAGGTWISEDVIKAYTRLAHLGFAHSVESWFDGVLAGGLYGVSIGGAFFGESMFHRKTDASKVALVALVERMKQRGMVLLDVQFMTHHLRRLGAIEISRDAYERRLFEALNMDTTFVDWDTAQPSEEA